MKTKHSSIWLHNIRINELLNQKSNWHKFVNCYVTRSKRPMVFCKHIGSKMADPTTWSNTKLPKPGKDVTDTEVKLHIKKDTEWKVQEKFTSMRSSSVTGELYLEVEIGTQYKRVVTRQCEQQVPLRLALKSVPTPEVNSSSRCNQK